MRKNYNTKCQITFITAINVEPRESLLGLGVNGLNEKKLFWAPIPTDIWLNLHMIIHWSTKENGSLHLIVDDHPELEFKSQGRNMLNSFQHYFKVGQYRDPSVKNFSVIYVKNISIKKI